MPEKANSSNTPPFRDTIDKSLIEACDTLFKSRVTRVLTEHFPSFVVGSRESLVDSGLIVTDDELPKDSDLTARLIDLLPRYLEQPCLLSLNITTVDPHLSAKERGAYYNTFKCTTEQLDQCAAFILQNPSHPDLIAIMPSYYLRQKTKAQAGYVCGHKAYLTGVPVEPFPVEWCPFVMRFTHIAAAVQSILDFVRGSSIKWQNPYNGLEFDGCPKPTLLMAKVLLPPDVGRMQDTQLVDVGAGEEKCSTRVELEDENEMGGKAALDNQGGVKNVDADKF